MSDPSEPTPEPAAPETESDKVVSLLDRLHLEHTENTLANVWGWATEHLGWRRPEPPPAP